MESWGIDTPLVMAIMISLVIFHYPSVINDSWGIISILKVGGLIITDDYKYPTHLGV